MALTAGRRICVNGERCENGERCANQVRDPAQLVQSNPFLLPGTCACIGTLKVPTYLAYGEGPDSFADWSILHLGLLIGLVLTVFQLCCHFQPDDLVLQGVIEACDF